MNATAIHVVDMEVHWPLGFEPKSSRSPGPVARTRESSAARWATLLTAFGASDVIVSTAHAPTLDASAPAASAPVVASGALSRPAQMPAPQFAPILGQHRQADMIAPAPWISRNGAKPFAGEPDARARGSERGVGRLDVDFDAVASCSKRDVEGERHPLRHVTTARTGRTRSSRDTRSEGAARSREKLKTPTLVVSLRERR